MRGWWCGLRDAPADGHARLWSSALLRARDAVRAAEDLSAPCRVAWDKPLIFARLDSLGPASGAARPRATCPQRPHMAIYSHVRSPVLAGDRPPRGELHGARAWPRRPEVPVPHPTSRWGDASARRWMGPSLWRENPLCPRAQPRVPVRRGVSPLAGGIAVSISGWVLRYGGAISRILAASGWASGRGSL